LEGRPIVASTANMVVGFFFEYFPGEEDGHDFGNGAEHEESQLKYFKLGVARVPCVLLRRIAAVLDGHHNQCGFYNRCLPLAWMTAIGFEFPDTPLAVLRSGDASLLPQCLSQHFNCYHVRTHGSMCRAVLFLCLNRGSCVGLVCSHQHYKLHVHYRVYWSMFPAS
jgi:hypothetical protein